MRRILCGLSVILSCSFGVADSDFRIIGFDDLIPVNELALNIPPQFRHIPDAVGMIQPLPCTATHVGRGLVLTAGHCILNVEGSYDNIGCPANTTITWGYRGTRVNGTKVSRCLKVVAVRFTATQDWAVLKVDQPPRAAVGIQRRANLRVGHPLTIFSHPGARPLLWSRTCRVERPLPAPYGTHWLYHRCDTNGGSSGAAIIDAVTGLIVGIHSAGDQYYNLGSLIP